MSPGLGVSKRSHYGSYSSDAWSSTVNFSVDDAYGGRSRFIACSAFDILTLIALICFLIWACLIRRPRPSMVAVISSLATGLVAIALFVVYDVFFLARATLTEYYRIEIMILNFFQDIHFCLLFLVFYKLIDGVLDRLTDTGRPYASVAYIHWVALGIVFALAIADWSMDVAYQVFDVNQTSSDLFFVYEKFAGAVNVVYWAVSLEIVAWTIFILVKGSHRFKSKKPAIALIFGGVFWFALNMMWAVGFICYNSANGYYPPENLYLVESVCAFVFLVANYLGILGCCMTWGQLGQVGNGDDQSVVAAQYPYGAVSDQVYQAYQPYQQGQQPYSQQ